MNITANDKAPAPNRRARNRRGVKFPRRFNKGCGMVRRDCYGELLRLLLGALGVTTRQQVDNYRKGLTALTQEQERRVEEVFAKFNITEPWDDQN